MVSVKCNLCGAKLLNTFHIAKSVPIASPGFSRLEVPIKKDGLKPQGFKPSQKYSVFVLL